MALDPRDPDAATLFGSSAVIPENREKSLTLKVNKCVKLVRPHGGNVAGVVGNLSMTSKRGNNPPSTPRKATAYRVEKRERGFEIS